MAMLRRLPGAVARAHSSSSWIQTSGLSTRMKRSPTTLAIVLVIDVFELAFTAHTYSEFCRWWLTSIGADHSSITSLRTSAPPLMWRTSRLAPRRKSPNSTSRLSAPASAAVRTSEVWTPPSPSPSTTWSPRQRRICSPSPPKVSSTLSPSPSASTYQSGREKVVRSSSAAKGAWRQSAWPSLSSSSRFGTP